MLSFNNDETIHHKKRIDSLLLMERIYDFIRILIDHLFGKKAIYSVYPTLPIALRGPAVLSDEPRQNQGRGLVDHKLVKAPQ